MMDLIAAALKKTGSRFRLLLNSLLVLMITAVIFLPDNGIGLSQNTPDAPLHPDFLPDLKIIKSRIKPGDTISTILNPYIGMTAIYRLSDQCRTTFPLNRIKIGKQYKIVLQDNRLVRFEYDIDLEERLVIQIKQQEMTIFRKPIDYEIDLCVVSSDIQSNLFEAVSRSGEKSDLAAGLSDIFAWDIDFIRDIKPGDRFKVLIEKRFRDGTFYGYGKILAAFFHNNGTLYKAFLHKDASGICGYYDENGKSLQKAFLKAPLSFSRISSKFTLKRLHPIFKEYRSHPGVDYAAPKGTPIKAVGDGTIIQAGFNKGLGNYVVIRHPNGYTTSYNHMCRFSKKARKGRSIFQGDVIGFVGMTGWATGPHLDFRMTRNGQPIDPLKHKSPSADPVAPDEIEQFMAQARRLSKQIQTPANPNSDDRNAI